MTLTSYLAHTLRLALVLVPALAVGQTSPPTAAGHAALPTTDFTANFCGFPRAWTAALGEGVDIVVLRSPTTSEAWTARLSSLAPRASVRVEPLDAWLAGSLHPRPRQVILLGQRPADAGHERARVLIRQAVKSGATFVLPAYVGSMKVPDAPEGWREFVRQASADGAIVVGMHGRTYQLGALAWWRAVPVDVFALHAGVDGQSAAFADSLIEQDLAEPSMPVAAAAALLLGKNPAMRGEAVRAALRASGRRVHWMAMRWPSDSGRLRVMPLLSPDGWKDNPELSSRAPDIVERLDGSTLDAARLVGLEPAGPGDWALSVLNVQAAQKRATGKGVTVAILDHLFDASDASLAERLESPGCVVEDEPVFSMVGHGTWMARVLVRVAPGVRIMPVRVLAGAAYRASDPTDYYIKGLDYAVRHGAQIVTLSHRAVPKTRQADLDMAVQRAAEAGTTLVYIHYQGAREDVVDTDMIEFAGSNRQAGAVYVVGTGFAEPASFPYTWGVSQTAPLVAGVVAMMKEVNPRLTPSEIRAILLASGPLLPSGHRILDADLSVRSAASR